MSSNDEDTFLGGDGRTVSIKEITDLYRDSVSLASPLSGQINHIGNENYSLTCNFSLTDCDNLESLKTSKSYSLVTSDSPDKHIKSVHCTSHLQPVSELASVASGNGRFLARLKSGGEQNSKRQFLEIWDRSRLLKTIDIDKVEEHGSINVDFVFASMVWSPFGEQNKLLYVCQAKKQKFKSFFEQQVRDNKKQNQGEDRLRVEDWGECLSDIEHTIVGIIDVPEFKITTLDLNGYSLAGSRWLDEDRVISTAYSEGPRRLGIVYCNNRPSKLVIQEMSGSSSDVAFEGQSIHSPRVSHCGKKVVFLKNASFGAHLHSSSMYLFDVKSRQMDELCCDLFVENLPKNCFSTDDSSVLFVAKDSLHDRLCLINLQSKQVSKIKFPTSGLRILDYRHDIILATGSEINATPTLYVARMTSPDLVAWHQIEDCIHVDELHYQIYRIETSDKASFVNALLVSPNLRNLYRSLKLKDTGKNEMDLPTVVAVHGGPHAAHAISYMPMLVFYARFGLKTLMINYRGSSGIDENYVQSLCGKIGTQDVDDCLQVLRHLAKIKAIDQTKLVIQGGSHGGFLACHLSCQSEFKFTSAIIRNPVVDITSMYTTSDIPDWCFSEALGHSSYDFAWLPDKEDLIRMFECSPMKKYRDANVPTLMLLGSKDRRVNMFQGERWVDLLGARGVETRCKIYADKHDLGKPDTHADSYITALIWILQHLERSE